MDLMPAAGATFYSQTTCTRYIAAIERLALWDGPAAMILLMASTAVVVMVASLSRRVCLKLQYEPIGRGGQFRTALIHINGISGAFLNIYPPCSHRTPIYSPAAVHGPASHWRSPTEYSSPFGVRHRARPC